MNAYKLAHEHCARRARLGKLIRHGGRPKGKPGSICSLCWNPGYLALVGPISLAKLARAAARRRVA